MTAPPRRHRASTLPWLGVAAAACAGPPPAPAVTEPWPAMDALFQRDPRWLGGDAVYSVDLGHERILWSFGDSFVALDGQRDRRRATMVRNTLAIQHGLDPATATLQFHWQTGADGTPRAAFPDDGAIGFWPLHGVRLADGPLLLYQTRVRNTPGQGLGFAIDGWRALCIDDPDAAPERWQPRELAFAAVPADVTFGTAVAADGDHVLLLGTRGNGPHVGVLARFATRALAMPVIELQCWCDGRWQAATAAMRPDTVLADAGPECSLHRHGNGWLHTYSRGFGRSTIAMSVAAAATGPWPAPVDVATPPESQTERPFVYAGKAHGMLPAGDGRIAVSYAANSFDFGELFQPKGQAQLYWPRFLRVAIP